jgi:peptidoglycan/LPS O-acetylase OafA/YrhL
MTWSSYLPIAGVVGMALWTSRWALRWVGELPAGRRVDSIDGLRGYLALFVFIHHAAVWRGFLENGVWENPASVLYANLGRGSVMLFFMITGLLFFSKLLNAREGSLDWVRLCVSRFLRIVPLYALVLTVICGVVFGLSSWQRRVSLWDLAEALLRWASFTGSPDLNGFADTSRLVAGVTWTLGYEWAFYASLPVFAVLMGIRVPAVLSVAALGCLGGAAINLSPVCWAPFVPGAVAAWAVRSPRVQAVAGSRWVSVVVLLLLGSTIFCGKLRALLCVLSAAFFGVASGNPIFGVLTAVGSRVLGEISYGMYLLHGLLLYAWFGGLSAGILGPEVSRFLLGDGYWLGVGVLTPMLVLVSVASLRWIERPAMRRVEAWTVSLRRCAGLLVRGA